MSTENIERSVHGKRYKLTKHRTSPYWQITWYDNGTGQTSRRSTKSEDIGAAEKILDDFVLELIRPNNAEPEEVPLALVMSEYLEEHAVNIASCEQAVIANEKIINFFGTALVGDLSQALQSKFVAHLKKTGLSDATISRDLSVLRAAINRANKFGTINSAPHIMEIRSKQDIFDAEPIGRPLSLDEMARFFNAITQPHVFIFTLIGLCTLARPGAIVDLTVHQVDFETGLIDLLPAGRKQTAKRRPTIPLAKTLIPFVLSASGHLVQFNGKPVKSVRTAWRNTRRRAVLLNRVNPYSLRHAMGRELRRRGVPRDQISILLGHLRTSANDMDLIYSPDEPDYCREAVNVIDEICADLAEKIGRPFLPEYLPQLGQKPVQNMNGACELRVSLPIEDQKEIAPIDAIPLELLEKKVVGERGFEPPTPTFRT